MSLLPGARSARLRGSATDDAVRPERSAAPSAAARSRGTRRRGTLRLRRGRASDAPAIAAVMRAAIRALAAAPYRPEQIAAWSSLPALYHRWAMTAGRERYLVAERAGRVVGYAAVRDDELTAVFVRPAHARGGVGAALVARAEREARRAGIAVLRLDAALGAVPFYARLGFAPGRRRRVPLPGGGALEARAMRKTLAAAGPRPDTRRRRARSDAPPERRAARRDAARGSR